VKARARDKAAEMQVRARDKAAEVKARTQGKATELSARVRQSQIVQRRWPIAVAAAFWRRRTT